MTKAYIAGVGTTAMLVVATFLLLVVVSALFAFRGWPEQDGAGTLPSYVVDRPSPQAPVAGIPSGTATGPRPGAPGPAVVAGDRGSGGGGRSIPRTEPAPVRPAPPAQPEREFQTSPAPRTERAFADPAPAEPPEDLDRPATGVERLGRSLGDTTQRLTEGLGNILTPVSPSLGAAVTGTGDRLAQGLRTLGAPGR